MRNRSRISVLVLAMALSCTAAMAADAPAKKPWKEGWDRKTVKVFAYACTDGLVGPAARNYNAAAPVDKVTVRKPFPEQEFRDSAFPMCLCISDRVAQTWTVAEVGTKGLQRAQPMIDEALRGGQCKPDGLLGQVLQKHQESK
jgi:hypothetical protein